MVNAVASQPSPENAPASKLKDFKVADPQFILSADPTTSVEEMENVIWQGIGGHEILSLARRDLIDGKNINYNLISGLKQLFEEYNPKTILAIENSAPLYFNAFGIKFELYLPSLKILNRVDPDLKNPVTIDKNNEVSIYFMNIKDSYDVEIQSLSAQEVLRDTIYGEGIL
jgi:hypothetical protein